MSNIDCKGNHENSKTFEEERGKWEMFTIVNNYKGPLEKNL